METARLQTQFDKTSDKIQTLEKRVNQNEKGIKLQEENFDKEILVISKYGVSLFVVWGVWGGGNNNAFETLKSPLLL